MTLYEFRKSFDVTQTQIARRGLFGVASNVSQLESRRDMLLSTLGRYLVALAGTVGSEDVSIRVTATVAGRTADLDVGALTLREPDPFAQL